ncbi:hypothetical protein Desti_4367 [Desulfomonile tiedjei DSM 6799]|uniref:Uncharacterized protein n=1 Tax=Desulfomonile tiedjei (strain ATCC 49306 / DSM 6799 / DCB-1) TaxID=706587 RepID=I4CBQ9_DESTA|nr:hypothetical protein Desti_4367 [Desulfomonile tiedjei DSM 6799]
MNSIKKFYDSDLDECLTQRLRYLHHELCARRNIRMFAYWNGFA